MNIAINAAVSSLLCVFIQSNLAIAQAPANGLPGTTSDASLSMTGSVGGAPASAAAIVKQADSLIEQGRVDEAEAVYRRALQTNPNWCDALAGIGLAKLVKGQLTDAQKDFYHTLDIDWRNARAHYGLGVSYLRQGNLREAVRELNNSLTENTGDAEAHFMLAETFKAQGNQKAALCEYKEAARLNPNHDGRYSGTSYLREKPTEQTIAVEELQSNSKTIPAVE